MAEAIARLKNVQSSPRKMRYVADMIRGMQAEKALYALQHSAKYGAKPMEKLLRSAMDNWEKKNEGIRIEDAHLMVKTVFVDGGRMLKRWLPAPHGRAYKKRKRSNHITLVVDSKIEQVAATPKGTAAEETRNEATATETKAPVKKSRSSKSKKATASA